MMFIVCPDCGRKIPEGADACPRCGCASDCFGEAPKVEICLGDEFAMGSWGGENIVWTVLRIEDGRKLLITKDCIDCLPFNDNPENGDGWENSSLKTWLEGEFAETAGLPGVPFCLSTNEAFNYFTGDDERVAGATELAIAHGARVANNGGCCWWLRTAGHYPGDAADVGAYGYVYSFGVPGTDTGISVRPAMWLDL